MYTVILYILYAFKTCLLNVVVIEVKDRSFVYMKVVVVFKFLVVSACIKVNTKAGLGAMLQYFYFS